jgi:hypothetical protein
MTQEKVIRLVVHIEPTLHKAAKAIAALRGITLRDLVVEAVRKEIEGKPGGEVPLTRTERIQRLKRPEPEGEAPAPAAGGGRELEDAVAAQLEKEVERAKAEHERRVAAGVIKR